MNFSFCPGEFIFLRDDRSENACVLCWLCSVVVIICGFYAAMWNLCVFVDFLLKCTLFYLKNQKNGGFLRVVADFDAFLVFLLRFWGWNSNIIVIMRLDVALVAQNIYSTRAKAVAAIKAGLVSVNGATAKKPSQIVAESDELTGAALPYVSGRGSLKLEHALDSFGVNPNGFVCLDIGASTGGFTEVLLSRGAAKVYAVDVGTKQLIPELRDDSRVVSLEQTDIRNLAPIEKVDLIVIDVSFISLADIVGVLPAWGAKYIIALIKPQFEVPRNIAAASAGVIKSDEWHQYSITRATEAFEANGFARCGLVESPIRGGSGNIEYLACFS